MTQRAARKSERILLVGAPTVGKHVLLHALTEGRLRFEARPGSSVDLVFGVMEVGGHHAFEIIETPGDFNASPRTPEERETARLVRDEPARLLVQFVEAKDLEAALPGTLRLIGLGRPLILVINRYDERLVRDMQLDIAHLEHDLGVPVVETVAVGKVGVNNLSSRVVEVLEGRYLFGASGRTLPKPKGDKPVSARAYRETARDIIAEAACRPIPGLAEPEGARAGKYLCDCFGITREQLRKRIKAQGLTTIQDVIRVTEAGSGCMVCHPEIRELLKKING